MNRKYLIISILLILIGLLILNYSEGMSVNRQVPHLKSGFSLEDSIIIKALKMESDTPPKDELNEEDGEGSIIYDDGFDDEFISTGSGVSRKKNSHSGEKRLPAIDRLKAKDMRWHLVRYRIRNNDNLWKIASRFGISHSLIINVNNIDNPDMLLPGKYINIPSRRGITYNILKGDTLGGIAKRYGIGIQMIKEQNGLKSTKLIAGKKLFLPGVTIAAKKTTKRISKRNRIIASGRGRIRFLWPLKGKLTSGFGTRKDPFSNRKQFHCGIDISANIGKRVKASADGKVIFSGWKTGYGKVVIIRHKMGYISVYAHNSRNIVPAGKRVRSGQVIALSGNTGAVTGAHLHFEIRKYVTPLNPLRILK